MASRFWVGGTGTWDASATTHWSATTGGTSGASVPTSADDVFLDGNSGAGTVTLGADVNAKTVNFTGYTGTFTPGAVTVNLAGTSGTVWTAVAGMTLTANTATIVLTTASTSTRTFAGGGKTYGTITYTVANSPGALAITGANTFSVNIGSGRQLVMPSSTTNTVNGWTVSSTPNGYLYLPGVSGNYASAPNSAALSTVDIDIRVRAALDDWTPTAAQDLCSKYIAVGNQRGWVLRVNTNGILLFAFSTDGATTSNATSSVAPSVSDGAALWIRVTRVKSTGVVTFYTASGALTAPSGADWAILGTTTTAQVNVAIFTNTAPLENGAGEGGLNPIIGKLYKVDVRNNVLDNGTGVVFAADFTTKAVGANTFTEGSTNAATVTINGVLAQAGDGRVAITSSTSGTAATLSKTSGSVSSDYLSIKDSTATGGAAWFAGANSTNVSGNTGWTFTVPTFTGTSAQTLPSFTQSATGTRTVPTFTGTSTQTLPSFTQTAAGTFTKPVYTGTSAQTLPSFTQAASGTVTPPTYTATAAQALPALTQAAAGTVTAPTYTATAAQTLPSFSQTATGTVTQPVYTATSAQTLPSLTQTASGTSTAPTYTGIAAQTLPGLNQVAAGTVTAPTYTATAASVLAATTQHATGTVTAPTFTATAAQTLPAISQTATGTVAAIITPTPAERVYVVAAETRVYIVARETRHIIVATESRTTTVPAETRTIRVPAENRTVEVV